MIIYSQKYFDKYNQITKYYKELDLKKSSELYTESHHIIPRCMGGSAAMDNLIRVPARVHFLLHWMLYRMYRTPEMAFAWHCMSRSSNESRYNSRSFSYAKSAMSIAMSITKKGRPSWNKGKTSSIETRQKISVAAKGLLRSPETKIKMSIAQKGRIITNEAKIKMSMTKKSTAMIKCPHCNKTSNAGNMKRWHFSKCKSLVTANLLLE